MPKIDLRLKNLISIERRYTRSIHLERDFCNPDSILGYVITPQAQDMIDRFVDSFQPKTTRAWTVTGVYGTGKSSLAHFLTALCSNHRMMLFERARNILEDLLPAEAKNWITKIQSQIPAEGLVRAVATARREPVHHTVLRALCNGITEFYNQRQGRSASILNTLKDHVQQLDANIDFSPELIFEWITEIHKKTGTGILLILDELGKVFEYTAQHPHQSDLFLLQRLAEYPSEKPAQGLFVFGLLHQAFGEYIQSVSGVQSKEWSKIQGRFEDVAFAESPEQILRLMGHSINIAPKKKPIINPWAENWYQELSSWTELVSRLPSDIFLHTYPLHPLAALALPQICQRYGQNERSLFTFLASSEPHSLQSFLQTDWKEEPPPTLKMAQLYDYFVASSALATSVHSSVQRWNEIQSRLADAHDLDEDSLLLLKTIAVFNLISLSGAFRARWNLVLSAVQDEPLESGSAEYKRWHQKLNNLVACKFVVWWERLDELRIWQGSNFDIDAAVQAQLEAFQLSPLDVFQTHCPLSPWVAQRHSYETGTLRYFERRYFNQQLADRDILEPDSKADGFIYYSLDTQSTVELPKKTKDGRPILYLFNSNVHTLVSFGHEYASLHAVSQNAPELTTDTVARKEVDRRLAQSYTRLQEQLFDVFHSQHNGSICISAGQEIPLKSETDLRRKLSDLCESTYKKGLRIWNELLNRRELTTQGAKARHKLIEYMLENNGQENLGIEGYGPERSMFESMLNHTGMYRYTDGAWNFHEPIKKSGVYDVWDKIRKFCFGATELPQSVEKLFLELQRPSYGVKTGPLPVLLAAVLLQFSDEISLFQDGTFVPVLGIAHFELLFRHPSRFAVKSFAIDGFQASYFKELRELLIHSQTKPIAQSIRNQTVLSLVTPLIRFIKQLPDYTIHTTSISPEAQALRQVLLTTQDPSQLLFVDLPQALGVPAIIPTQEIAPETLSYLKKNLAAVLNELQKAYPELLRKCQITLEDAFEIPSHQSLRDMLVPRASFLKQFVSERGLTRFVQAASDPQKADGVWTESVAMIIADKSPQKWKDQDFIRFEQEVPQIKRQFINFEALQMEIGKQHTRKQEAKRLVLTDSTGKETQRIIWVDKQDHMQAEQLIDKFLLSSEVENNAGLRAALLAALAEKLLDI